MTIRQLNQLRKLNREMNRIVGSNFEDDDLRLVILILDTEDDIQRRIGREERRRDDAMGRFASWAKATAKRRRAPARR